MGGIKKREIQSFGTGTPNFLEFLSRGGREEFWVGAVRSCAVNWPETKFGDVNNKGD